MKLHKRHDHRIPGVGYWGERGDVKYRVNFGTLKPGEVFPEDPLHHHKTRITYFCVLEGSMLVEVDKETVIVTKDAMLEIPPLSNYRVFGVGEGGCTWVVLGSHNENDRVEV